MFVPVVSSAFRSETPSCAEASPTPPSRRRVRRAAAAVEFAIVAPLLFVIILGTIEFGRMMMVLELLNNAARNGARLGVVSGNDTAAVQQAVTDTLTSTSVSGATSTVQVNGTSADVNTAATGDTITVTVSVPASSVSWLPSALFLGGKTLTSTASMRHE